MDNFWNKLPKPFFALAPMEAVTDVVFRHVVAAAARPDIFFTEFISSAGYCSPKGTHSTYSRLKFTDDEQPIVAQIWGNNPEHFRLIATDLQKMGFAGIDINMGCPEKSVVKGGSGIGLCHTPELASQLIAAAKASGLPVSVKTRLGYTRAEEYEPWLGHILRQDIANLTVHLRTRKEMNKVEAHFELVPGIKKLRDEIAPQTLLTINGDIRDRQHGLGLVERYGVDGIMIGRGVFHNPFAFRSITADVESEPFLEGDVPVRASQVPWDGLRIPVERSLHENGSDSTDQKSKLMDLLNLHLDLHDKYSTEQEPRKFDPLKRFFKIYVRDFAGASDLREELMRSKTTDEVRQILLG